MKQQHDTEVDKRQSSVPAPMSDRGAQRISVMPKGEGIKVCDGDTFDPYRFQEFDFSPAFREKMMRAALPLLDLRELHGDKTPLDRARPTNPYDVTQPASSSVSAPSASSATDDLPRAPSRGMRLLLARKKLRKITGSAFDGKAAKKLKYLLFGSLFSGPGLPSE